MALADLPASGEDEPQLVVFAEEDPWSRVKVPRVNIENVFLHYEDEECVDMPEATKMRADEDDTDARRVWNLQRKIWIPPQWADKFCLLPFDEAMTLLEELVSSVTEAHMPDYLSLCAWVATACCCANKGNDTSILAVRAIRVRRSPRVKEVARQLWSKFQGREATVATTKGGQKKKPSKMRSLTTALQAASARQQKKPAKGQRAAPVTPRKRRKPRKRASSAEVIAAAAVIATVTTAAPPPTVTAPRGCLTVRRRRGRGNAALSPLQRPPAQRRRP